MTHTKQVLSDEQMPSLPEPAAWRTPDEWPMFYSYTHEEPDAERISWAARYGRKHEQVYTEAQMREYARRAIESATLKAVSGQEPVAWMMEWPNHSPSFTIDKSDYVSWINGKAHYPSDLRPLYTLPPAQPAPVDEREAFEATMREKHGWEDRDFLRDSFGYHDGHTATAWMAWQARAALQCAQAPQPTKGGA